MTTNDLLVLLAREETLLTADNWHSSGAVIRLAVEHIRDLQEQLRKVEKTAG